MTREELIQTPEYWRTLYENECERLGIEPILHFFKPLKIEERYKCQYSECSKQCHLYHPDAKLCLQHFAIKYAKEQRMADVEKLKSVLNALMVETKDKAAIIKAMEE